MTMNTWIKTPKGRITLVLFIDLLIASIGYRTTAGIKQALVAVGVAVIVDVIFCIKEKRKRIMPDGAVVTGLLIALVLSTTTHLVIVAATSVIAIVSKHLFVQKKKPVFNPAVFGLLASILIFHTGQSWWGAFGDLPAWTIGFLIVGGYWITHHVQKFPQAFAFLTMYLLLLWLMGIFNVGDAWDALRSPFINAAVFFAFFMLTDLPTSPAKNKGQVVFGTLTAVIGALVYARFGGLMYLFIGLLIADAYHSLKARNLSARRERQSA